MIKVLTPNDKGFDKEQCMKLYNQYKSLLEDGNFIDVLKRTMFFAFHIASTDELIGCIYYYENDGKLFLNAFANRKHHLLNLECFKESLKWFKCDVYAKSNQKTAIYCLLKNGFKKLKEDLFIYRR